MFSIEPTGSRPLTGAAGADRSVCRLTFRSAVEEITALLAGGRPYYKPDWATDVLGMIIDNDTAWDEVGELLTESYCLLAPKKLTTRVIRPSGIEE